MPKKVTTKKAGTKSAKKSTKKATKSTSTKRSNAKTTKQSPKRSTAAKATKKTPGSRAKLATEQATKKAGKKANSKKAAKDVKLLVCASDSECFWTTDGQVLKNLDELQLAFGTMDDEVFMHHVTKEKNDFADWVEQVLGDSDCAAALRRSRKPSSARTVVVKHLRLYNV